MQDGFYKVFDSGDQDQLLVRCDNRLFTFFEGVKSIKSAATSAVSEKLMRENQPDDRHYGALLVALGASEYYGFNRNGDWWNEPSLIKRHPTFVKYGHYFLEHKHDDPSKAIGEIKASAWNPDLKRVELIVHGDKEKDAQGYTDAKAGREISYSMSAKIKGDICSCCFHFAPTSKSYCEHARKFMTQWLPKFRKFVYVDNVDPTFFDLSRVGNRADRIARDIQFQFNDSEMQKAASANAFIFSEEKAKRAGVRKLPEMLTESQQAWLRRLQEIETEQEVAIQSNSGSKSSGRLEFMRKSARSAFRGSGLTEAQTARLRDLDPEVFFHKLAHVRVVLPFFDFFAYVTQQTLKQASQDTVYQHARNQSQSTLFRDLGARLENAAAPETFRTASAVKMACAEHTPDADRILESLAQTCSVHPGLAASRILRICASGSEAAPRETAEKNASILSPEEQARANFLVRSYGIYKLAFCESAAMQHTQSLDESELILTVSQR